ncbi:hypothetical protein P7K49_032650 [Saguinus oedipus]|uniref:Uncharacterized protein n=1 Tax=Saguinus oedipus TaxID=9490 RepID=A0ABQ9TYV7_SAGOE|nr:hypothetical protein P7K49_032650 [Saguinus oedipus]
MTPVLGVFQADVLRRDIGTERKEQVELLPCLHLQGLAVDVLVPRNGHWQVDHKLHTCCGISEWPFLSLLPKRLIEQHSDDGTLRPAEPGIPKAESQNMDHSPSALLAFQVD